MLKSYLEYELTHTFGGITSQPSNIVFDSTGKCAFTGSLEYVNLWNLRQGSVVSSFSEKSKKKEAKVSLIRLSPDGTRIAVGYARETGFSFRHVSFTAPPFTCNV